MPKKLGPPSKTPHVRQPARVKSCARTLDVLEFFIANRRPARTIEVSSAIGMPNSSADEILRTLSERGYLSFDRVSKRYIPSYKLVSAGIAIQQGFFGGDRVRKVMVELQQETGANVCLTALNDCRMEDVGQLHSGTRLLDRPAAYDPLLVCRGASGWQPSTNFAAVLLALQTNQQVMEITERMQQMGAMATEPVSLKRLIERVGRTRSRGFAVLAREDGSPVDSIAFPLRIDRPVAPLAVGIWGERLFETRRQRDALIEGGQEIIRHFS